MSRYAFQAVIFDCDGVLVDTERPANRIWQKKLAELGLNLSLEEMHHHFTGYTTQGNLAKAAELLGRPLPENFFDSVRSLFMQEFSTGLPVIPEIETTLEQIALPKATATNARRREMNFKLETTGLLRFFKYSLCCEDVASPKPAPDIYLQAATRLGIAPQYCAVVEDSVAGVQAGVAAGMTVFGFCRDTEPTKQLAAGARQCFTDMKDLPGLLAK